MYEIPWNTAKIIWDELEGRNWDEFYRVLNENMISGSVDAVLGAQMLREWNDLRYKQFPYSLKDFQALLNEPLTRQAIL